MPRTRVDVLTIPSRIQDSYQDATRQLLILTLFFIHSNLSYSKHHYTIIPCSHSYFFTGVFRLLRYSNFITLSSSFPKSTLAVRFTDIRLTNHLLLHQTQQNRPADEGFILKFLQRYNPMRWSLLIKNGLSSSSFTDLSNWSSNGQTSPT